MRVVDKRIQVLLVEDNLLEAEFVCELMADQAVDFIYVRSLAQAEAELESNQPDAILLDMTLPDSDGLETVERMLQLSGAPVIILTGHDDIDIALQSVNFGAADHITKGTFNSDSLMRTMLYAIERKNVLKRMNLQTKSAEALMSCSSVAEALEIIIKDVCKELGWDFGCFCHFDERGDAVVTTRWPADLAQSFIESGQLKVHSPKACSNSDGNLKQNSIRTIKLLNLDDEPGPKSRDGDERTKTSSLLQPATHSGRRRWYPQPNIDNKRAEIISDLSSFCCASTSDSADARRGKFDKSHCQAAIKAGMKTGMFVPIVTSDTLFGVIEFFSTKRHENDDLLIRHLNVLGSQIAHAILRERAEQALADSEKSERQVANHVIQHASAGIVRLDTNLTVQDANDAFLRIISTDPKPQGKCLFKILPFLPADEIRRLVEKRRTYTVKRLRLQGSMPEEDQYLSFSIWPITGDGSELVGAAAMVVDDSPQVALEQQKDDLVAAVAHDIKNPLIGAERVLGGLSDDLESMPETTRHAVASLLSSTRNLIRLVQNLVDLYRYDSVTHSIQKEHVRAIPLLKQCLEQLRPFAASNEIALHEELSPHTPDLFADEVALSRVIVNLMYNAIKFTTPGGKVVLSSLSEGEHVILRVTDNGIGVHPNDQSTLFHRYFQGRVGKRLQSGTGLGLYISKLIVEAHNGQIDLQSELGMGTAVTLRLPAYSALTTQSVTVP